MTAPRCKWRKLDEKSSTFVAAAMRGTKSSEKTSFCLLRGNARNRKNKLELTCFNTDRGIMTSGPTKTGPMDQETVREFRAFGCKYIHR